MYEITPGAVRQSVQIYMRDSSTNMARIGLTAASPGAGAGYARHNGPGTSFTLTALPGPTAPWQSGGFVEIDPLGNPGVYRLDPPDAANIPGAAFVTYSLRFAGSYDESVLVLLRLPSGAIGPGAATFAVTLLAPSTAPVPGAGVWVSTDLAGSNVIAGALMTGPSGTATFLLDDGDYYLWINAPGYAPANPYFFTVLGNTARTYTLPVAAPPVPFAASAGEHGSRVTAHDVMQRLLDYGGADTDRTNARAVKVAISDALREFATSHEWSYLRTFGRVAVTGPYAEGTVEYLESSGAYPRQVTLTGGVWPNWAARGYIRIAGIVAKVDVRVSGTVLTLKDPCYADDRVADDTGYTLYRDTYTLPADFVVADHPLAETCWGALRYIRHAEWLGLVRHVESVGTPVWWTVAGDPDVPGRLALKVYPAPHENGTLDYVYQRKPREVRLFDLTEGKATAHPDDPNLITLSAAVLKPSMVGSVIRLSDEAVVPPDNFQGENPYSVEGNITAVLSPTQLRIDTPVGADFAAVAYRISDPIDAEDLQQVVIGRSAEKHFALSRILKTRADAVKAWADALLLAKEADVRCNGRQASGAAHQRPLLLRERGRIDFTA